MTRYVFTLDYPSDRQRVARVIAAAPDGSRVEIKGARRSNDQNSKLWAMLTDVATHREHNGRKYTPDQWKILFMHACGREVQFIPSLDNKTFLPWGSSSRDLSKIEMSDLLEFIHAWGAEQGVTFHDKQEPAAA